MNVRALQAGLETVPEAGAAESRLNFFGSVADIRVRRCCLALVSLRLGRRGGGIR